MTIHAEPAEEKPSGLAGAAGTNQGLLGPITETWAFDIFVRAVYVIWFLFVGIKASQGLGSDLARHGSIPDAQFIATVLARVAVILFIGTLIAFVIVRRRPVRKSQGLWPRSVAFLGTFIVISLPLFPANEMSLAGLVASVTLVFVGNGLSVYAAFGLGRSISIMPEARRLVTSGPYAIVRHPLYAAEEIAVFGSYLIYASPWTTALLILHGYLQIRRMGYEEAVLGQAFPDYKEYARRTARLIPGLY